MRIERSHVSLAAILGMLATASSIPVNIARGSPSTTSLDGTSIGRRSAAHIPNESLSTKPIHDLAPRSLLDEYASVPASQLPETDAVRAQEYSDSSVGVARGGLEEQDVGKKASLFRRAPRPGTTIIYNGKVIYDTPPRRSQTLTSIGHGSQSSTRSYYPTTPSYSASEASSHASTARKDRYTQPRSQSQRSDASTVVPDYRRFGGSRAGTDYSRQVYEQRRARQDDDTSTLAPEDTGSVLGDGRRTRPPREIVVSLRSGEYLSDGGIIRSTVTHEKVAWVDSYGTKTYSQR